MYTNRIIKPLLFSFAVLSLGGLFSKASWAESPAKASPVDESEIATLAIENLLNSIKVSSCDFNIEASGSSDPQKTSIENLDLDCMAQLSDKEDLLIPIQQSSDGQGFGAQVRISTKSLYIHFQMNVKGDVKQGRLRFYSGYDKARNQWITKPVEISVAVLNKNKVMNSEILALQLSEAEVLMKTSATDSQKEIVKGQCKASKKVFNLGTMKDELRPADCRFDGIHDGNEMAQFNFVFRNSVTNASLKTLGRP